MENKTEYRKVLLIASEVNQKIERGIQYSRATKKKLKNAHIIEFFYMDVVAKYKKNGL